MVETTPLSKGENILGFGFFFFLLRKANDTLLLRSASDFSWLSHMKPLETLNICCCQWVLTCFVSH